MTTAHASASLPMYRWRLALSRLARRLRAVRRLQLT
jgi:hypothetical protein